MNGSVSRSFMSLQSDIYLKSTRAFTVAQLMLVVGRWPQLLDNTDLSPGLFKYPHGVAAGFPQRK